MLTGDIQKVADYVARDLGVDEVHAELLPADKVARVEELLCLLLLTALRCTSALAANGDVASAVEET